MKLRGILHALMYKDKATVLRAIKTLADDGSDDYEEEYAAVYEDIPCKLSQYGKELPAHIEERAMVMSADLRLCCDPETDIAADDVVKVNHQGQVFTLYAGQAFDYPTHKEISLRRRKEAGNGD